MKNYTRLFGVVIFALLISACQKETQTEDKNIEEIYKEKGIPVVTRTMVKQDFSTYLTFTSSLKGMKESTGSSMVADTIEDVLVDVGDYVKKDQTIIRFPKNNPSAKYYQSMAAFNAAEQAYKRIENLYKSNGVSRQTYDDTKTQYEVQKANWTAVNDMLNVKAPISGYITRLNVHESENVKAGDTLFTVSNYDKLISVVWVSDREISQIKKGQRAQAQWEGTTLNGVVDQVDLAMDARQKAFAVQVAFGNSEHSVPSGVTASINIETRLIPDSLVVHRSEVLKNQDGWYVYLDKDGKAVKQTIETGLSQGMLYEVTKGLKENDMLITEGINMVRDGSLVRIVDDVALLTTGK